MTETFQKIERKQGSKWPGISIYEHCINLNALAVKQFNLKDVKHVEMYWSQKMFLVGISPTNEASKGSYALSRATHSGTRVISCQGFINKFIRSVVKIADQRQLKLEKSESGMLIATLEKPDCNSSHN